MWQCVLLSHTQTRSSFVGVMETSGIHAISPDLIRSDKTIVVTGIGRSGTTAMTKVLQAIGMPKTGVRKDSTQDDHLLGKLIESRDFGGFKDEVTRRDAMFSTWGFKWHLMWNHPEYLRALRNPLMICMSRDSLAITQRSIRDPVEQSGISYAEKVTIHQSSMWHYILQCRWLPIIVVSYEKLITKPSEVVLELSKLTGFTASDKAVQEVVPEDPRYLYPGRYREEGSDGYQTDEG